VSGAPPPSGDALKRAAAAAALERVESGMRVGLGSGSTVLHFLELLGERLRDGTLAGVVGVPTSIQTADRAHAAGIPLGALHEVAPLDVTVDGADEIDPRLDLIKGLGGALLREKIVAAASRRFVVIADAGKKVARLGARSPLPVEVAAFAWQIHVPFLESLGALPRLRAHADGSPVPTDNGNYVIDCRFPDGVPDPAALDAHLQQRPGVIETGLFLGMASEAIVAGEGGVEVLTVPARPGGPGPARAER
jgi:ribose 5-phosphate isomerase A